jgi:predicted permease
MNDLHNALRQVFKRPGLSAIVVILLALGIGSTTAMFSIFHAILLAPLPVPEADRLVNLRSPGPKWGMMNTDMAGDGEDVFSYPMFRDLEAQQDVFAGLAAHKGFDANLASGRSTMNGTGVLVSGEYFTALGAPPTLGRLILPADEPRLGESSVVVLSHAYWQDQFGGDPGVLGRALTVNGQPLTVIGVAPQRFSGTTIGARPDVFVPLSLRWRMQPTAVRDEADRRSYWLYLFARLRNDVSVERAAAGISALHSAILNEIEAPLNTDMPEDVLEQFRRRQISLLPGALGQSWIRSGPAWPALTLLLGVTALVLLIACANIANLLLARGAARDRELAVRVSVGATRGQLVRQLLTETAVLAVVGGLFSLPVAILTLQAIIAAMPAQQADMFALEIDSTAVIFAMATTFTTTLLFGLLPALRGSRADPGHVVNAQSTRASSDRGMLRFRGTLATTQIAVSTVLLVLAGLFAQSLRNVARVELGMEIESVATFSVSPRLNGYGPREAMIFFDRLEEELAAQPGMLDVASASLPVLSGNSMTRSLAVEHFESGPGIDSVAALNEVSPGFFSTLSIPLRAGRDFTRSDAGDTPRVAIVNESFAHKFGLGENALGTRLAIGAAATELDIEVVGVVADAKYNEVKDAIPAQFFLPRLQDDATGSLTFYVRSSLDPNTVFRAVPGIVAGIDPNLPVTGLQTLRTTVAQNVYLDRVITVLSSAFAALATLLAAIGLYGVLAYNITRRTRELGLRLALGATPAGVRLLVLKQIGRLAAIGSIAGTAAAVGLGRLTESLLFGVRGYDPVVVVVAVLILGIVVLGAGSLPARRASRIAPMEALRYE